MAKAMRLEMVRRSWLTRLGASLVLSLALLQTTGAQADHQTSQSLRSTRASLQRIRTLLVNQGRSVSLGTLTRIEVLTQNVERLILQDLRVPGGIDHGGGGADFDYALRVGARVLHLEGAEITLGRIEAIHPSGTLTLRMIDGYNAGRVITGVTRRDVAITQGELSGGIRVGTRVRQLGNTYVEGTIQGIQDNGRVVVEFDGYGGRLEKDWSLRQLQVVRY